MDAVRILVIIISLIFFFFLMYSIPKMGLLWLTSKKRLIKEIERLEEEAEERIYKNTCEMLGSGAEIRTLKEEKALLEKEVLDLREKNSFLTVKLSEAEIRETGLLEKIWNRS